MLTARAGASLAELLVAMVMLGVIGAAATNSLTQQGRVRTRVVARLVAEAQLREAIAPLLADLGAASPAAGDFTAGQATDTTVELRVAAAEAFVCALDGGDPATVHLVLLSSMLGRSIAAGDMAWLYDGESWTGAPVERVAAVGAPVDGCTQRSAAAASLVRVTLGGAAPRATGAAVRFTRRIRYSFYRASDGNTYLGLRAWSASTGGFASVQPVAGPLDRAGSRFRYLDTLGSPLGPSHAAGPALAQVIIELAGTGAPPAGRAVSIPPTLRATAALRNRR